MSRHASFEKLSLDAPGEFSILDKIILTNQTSEPPKDSASRTRVGYGSILKDPSAVSERALLQQSFSKHEQYALIAKLGMRLLDWNEPSSSAALSKSVATVPAGYTYFGQLIAHDISFTAETIPTLSESTGGDEGNLRRSTLTLETLYGGGPKSFPVGYQTSLEMAPKGGVSPRVKFRLGQIRKDGIAQGRDLPRLTTQHLAQFDGECPVIEPAATDVLIADGRNDDHAIISQLAALFMELHNRIADKLQDSLQIKAGSNAIERHRIFERAQHATIYLYQLLIWNDYLRRLLDPDVFARYAPPNLDSSAGLPSVIASAPTIGNHIPGVVPVEFSHAVFRFGHSMVRRNYVFGKDNKTFDLDRVLERSSGTRPDLMPFDETWLVNWRAFFGATDAEASILSRPIGPRITSIGPKAVFVDSSSITDPYITIEVSKWGIKHISQGLAVHDLVRSYSHKVATVSDLIKLMESDEKLSDIIQKYDILSNKDEREKLVSDWMDMKAPLKGMIIKDVDFEEKEKEFIARNPPLYIFSLLEAEHVHGGCRLGPLASFIVAETIAARTKAKKRTGPTKIQPVVEELVKDKQAVEDLNSVFKSHVPKTLLSLAESLEE